MAWKLRGANENAENLDNGFSGLLNESGDSRRRRSFDAAGTPSHFQSIR